MFLLIYSNKNTPSHGFISYKHLQRVVLLQNLSISIYELYVYIYKLKPSLFI